MLADRKWRICKNRLVLAGLAGTLVWFADQPTVAGYNPLLEMFWDPGLFHLPLWDGAVLLLSWFVTMLFSHFVLFSLGRNSSQAALMLRTWSNCRRVTSRTMPSKRVSELKTSRHK